MFVRLRVCRAPAPRFRSWPQQPEGKVYRIGFLGPAPFLKALEEGLRERGHIPGKNVIIEHRSDMGKDTAGRAALVDELIALRVDVLVASLTERALVAKRA